MAGTDLHVAGWKGLRQLVPDRPLSAAELTGQLLRYELPTGGKFVPLGGTAALIATGSLQVRVINDGGDARPDPAIGAAPRRGTEPGPPIVYEPDRAWVRTTFSGIVTGTLEVGPAALQLTRRATIDVWRSYGRETRLRDALDDSLSRPASPFSINDILSLGRREAVALTVLGRIGASISLLWSDILTDGVSTLGSLLPTELGLRVSAGARVAVPFRFEDEVMLILAKTADDEVRFDLRKVVETQRSMSAAITAEGAVTLGEELASGIEELISRWLGDDFDAVRSLADRVATDLAGGDERKRLAKVLDRIGMKGVLREEARELQAKLSEIEHEIPRRIRRHVQLRVTSGFAYEYRRLDASKSIFSGKVRRGDADDRNYRDRVTRHHTQALKGDFAALLEESDHDSFELLGWLDERKRVRRRAWGFALGIGPWFMKTRDLATMTEVRQLDREGGSSIAFIGHRSWEIESSLFAASGWSVDLRAEMAEFSLLPVTRDFEFGFHMLMRFAPHRVSSANIGEWVDLAAMWNVIPAGAERERTSELVATLASSTRVEAAVQLTFDQETLQKILVSEALRGADAMAEALSAAMPYSEMFPEREQWQLRERSYARAWRAALSEKGDALPMDVWRRIGAAGVDDYTRTASFELSGRAGSFAEIRARHPNIHGDWTRWREGINLLAAAIEQGTLSAREIPSMFDRMCRFWQQALYIRALGRLFTRAVAESGAARPRGSLRIEHTPLAGEPTVINFG
ncbi:MAG TPA: hypothetical protein VM557_06505 [Thermoanaerobaculia bacterium]|nr:hypothetical protein [Thermoanaerobaculia bacterium]